MVNAVKRRNSRKKELRPSKPKIRESTTETVKAEGGAAKAASTTIDKSEGRNLAEKSGKSDLRSRRKRQKKRKTKVVPASAKKGDEVATEKSGVDGPEMREGAQVKVEPVSLNAANKDETEKTLAKTVSAKEVVKAESAQVKTSGAEIAVKTANVGDAAKATSAEAAVKSESSETAVKTMSVGAGVKTATEGAGVEMASADTAAKSAK